MRPCVYVCSTPVRLIGTEPRKGRLEVLHNGAWGTVCDRSFNDTAAKVACSTLGFGYVLQPYRSTSVHGTKQHRAWSLTFISHVTTSWWDTNLCVIIRRLRRGRPSNVYTRGSVVGRTWLFSIRSLPSPLIFTRVGQQVRNLASVFDHARRWAARVLKRSKMSEIENELDEHRW